MNASRNLFWMGLLLFPSLAFGHARFKPGSATPPRNDSTGLKTGPCGMVPRTATPKVYKPGQEITVEWEETIDHPGFYIIKFSKENDAGFDDNVLVAKFVDTKNTKINSPAEYHQYSLKVKLPNVTCNNCTLQLIQHMDDNPERPYFSCSDIQLVDAMAPIPVPNPTPTPMPLPTTPPAPTPTPTPTPEVTPTPGTPAPTTPAPKPQNPATPGAQKPAKPQGLKIENVK